MDVLKRLRTAVHDFVDALDDDAHLLLHQVQSLALAPFRIATSPTAIKAYLSVLLFLTTSLTLVAVSSTAYLFFYYRFIPQISLEEAVYLQYVPEAHPFAIVPLQTTALIAQQQYDIEVVLHMPRTPTNLAAGNFMVDISLLSDKDPSSISQRSYVSPDTSRQLASQALFRSRRPAMLPYSSSITGLSYSLLHLPSHLLRLRDLDSSTVVVPLFEKLSFPRGRQNVPTYAYLEVQSQVSPLSNEACSPQAITVAQGMNMMSATPPVPLRTLQVYSAKLKFRARFRGLRYVVYNYRILSFLTFSTLFYGFAISSMAIVWAGISMFLNNDNATTGGALPRIKKEGREGQTSELSSGDSKGKIKAEEGGAGNISDQVSDENDPGAHTDTSATFPGLGRTVQPMRYPGSPPYSGEPTAEVDVSHRDDGTNDAEDEEDYQALPTTYIKEEEDDDEEMYRFGDSGIGTSMESETPSSGIVRRRSGRRS